ncbi:MAG TPA: S41 family peptidase [Nitrospirota bacterium]|nr:S41 family peptidase [Nitrospirota bacterium]
MRKIQGFAYWLLPLILGIMIGAFFHQIIRYDPVPSSDIPRAATPEFRLMAEAWNAIEQQYVDRSAVQPKTMTYGAISGMVESLGDTGHSVFMTPDMVQDEHSLERGEFAGIGAELQVKNKQLVIVAPMDGSPAQKAGLRSGDVIKKVDSRNVEGLPLPQVIAIIKGPPGTRVSLTIMNPATGEERTIEITRAKIEIRSVTWLSLPGTDLAYVRIALFSKGTAKFLEKTLAEIDRTGAKGLILDLRNDPGGLLDIAVGVESQFLKEGDALLEKDAHGKVRPVSLEGGFKKSSLPLVVLINEGTASAAEIVAGALQDAMRATLVGETTFGTGTVLKTIPLSDGSAVQLAFLEWLTPKGRTIWHKGITPDVTVSLPEGASPLIAEAERNITPEGLRASKDRQLLRAIEFMQSNLPTQRN